MGKIFESTPSYQKGLIGEEIVKKYLKSLDYIVKRSTDTSKSGASLIDFAVEQIFDDGSSSYRWLVEVKVKSPIAYSYGRFQVYMFSKSQIEKYEQYAKEKDLSLEIFIVDEKRESIFSGLINDCPGIEDPLRIEDKTFPLDVEQSNELGMYHVYSIHQFQEVAKIDFIDLERLRSIKFSNSDKKFFKPLIDSAKNISIDDLVKESCAVVSKYLELKLPEDIPLKNKKVSVLVKSLRPKLNRIPTCFFYEIYHAVHNINMSSSIQTFASQFYALLDEIKHERQKTSYKIPKVIEIKTPAKKIAELKAPNNTLLEIFEIEGNCPGFFIGVKNLRSVLGDESRCKFHWGIYDSIKAVSKFYYIFEVSKYGDETLAVAVKDMSLIVNEYIFNRADYISNYNEVKNFLEWWEKQKEIQSKPKNNSFTP